MSDIEVEQLAEPTGEMSPVAIDRSGVERCFGCGEANPEGLRLQFTRYQDGTVEVRHRTAPHHCGINSVVHGGIQATILDEVMGVAAQLSLPADASDLACVTAEMHLHYRRPVPIEDELVARARLDRVEGRDHYIVGAIVGPETTVLTGASSRWRQLRMRPS